MTDLLLLVVVVVMSIVTISRQIGSGGQEIGRRVAGQLGYRMVWRDLINQAAQHAGAPAVALAMIDEFGLLGIKPTSQECEKYIQVVNQILHDLAQQDNVVIVGRAGQVVLAGLPGCLHTRITAPQKLRSQRIAERQSISLSAATEQVKTSERYRQRYLKRFYQVNWADASLYDLVIDTGKISIEEAVDMICRAVRSDSFSGQSKPDIQHSHD